MRKRPSSLGPAGAFLIASWTLCAHASHRQIPMADYVQEVWEARDGGLPHPAVTRIVQTRDRYLWIGTYAGLARFDGISFHVPGGEETAAALLDHVRSIAEGGDGSLWVGTRRHGLARIQGREVRVFTTKEGLAGNDITDLAVTRDGTAWVGGAELRTVTAAGQVRAYGVEEGAPEGAVSALFRDADGTVWIGGLRGTLVWHDAAGFHAVRWSGDATPGTVTSIRRDPGGTLWIGTSNGLLQVEGERTGAAVAHRRVDGIILSLASGPLGVWASTENDLVHIDGAGEKRYDPSGGLLHAVHALAQDDQGSVWLGTRAGLAQLRPRIIRSYTRGDGLPSKLATCVLEARDGDLWIGTTGGLARRRQGQWSAFGTRDGLPVVSVRALAEGPDGTIWIGTADGLVRYAGGRFTLIPGLEKPYFIRSLAVDDGNRVWVGTYESGLDKLENGVLTRVLKRSETCAQSRNNFLFPVGEGDVWVGGSSALMRLREGRLECLHDPQDPPRDDVRYIGRATEGGYWIGSIGGLGRLTAAGRPETFPGPRSPFNTPNYAVLDDGRGSLWCSTPRGLFQVRKDDLVRAGGLAPARGFGVGDGLASSVMTADGQPSGWRGRDGRLYFTSADGVAVVEPGAIQDLPAPPPVYIERVVADRQPVPTTGPLPAGTRDVEIHFAAVSFITPELVRYRYQLEGFDAGWRDGENRRIASYTNLPPRRYRFRVIAADHSGAWNETGATLAFEVPPRFHQTYWFRGLVVTALLAAALGAHRYRLARVHARSAELQREVDDAVANIQMLRGMLPICAWCRRVREDSGYWQQIEDYVMERTDARFRQSLCADCAAETSAPPSAS